MLFKCNVMHKFYPAFLQAVIVLNQKNYLNINLPFLVSLDMEQKIEKKLDI